MFFKKYKDEIARLQKIIDQDNDHRLDLKIAYGNKIRDMRVNFDQRTKQYQDDIKQLNEQHQQELFDLRVKLMSEYDQQLKNLKHQFSKDSVTLRSELIHAESALGKEIKKNEDLNSQLSQILDQKERLEQGVFESPYSNLSALPYMSKIIADVSTFDFEIIAESLNYGKSKERLKKAASIRRIRAEAQSRIEQIKWAEYQLNYLLKLYPALQDVIETDYKELNVNFDDIQDVDPIRHYLSQEEWDELSSTEKNQLALDRYVASRKKSKWQIGRDYELYIGFLYQQDGYDIDYYGSYMGLEDLGRDLIAKKNDETLIIQCKYWSHDKKIHEKHIMQLYGSIISYQIENQISSAKGMIITNIELSNIAKKFASLLNIDYIEHKEIAEFPRIKCNIGHDENGITRIYHLPMDFQYDKTKINKPGETMTMTVAEAEAAGFRRTYKWYGKKQ